MGERRRTKKQKNKKRAKGLKILGEQKERHRTPVGVSLILALLSESIKERRMNNEMNKAHVPLVNHGTP